jgi:hypothetical protein
MPKLNNSTPTLNASKCLYAQLPTNPTFCDDKDLQSLSISSEQNIPLCAVHYDLNYLQCTKLGGNKFINAFDLRKKDMQKLSDSVIADAIGKQNL